MPIRPVRICALLVPLAWLFFTRVPAAVGAPLAALRVNPPVVDLNGPDARQTLLVTGTAAGGRQLDLTRSARVTVSDEHIARAKGPLLLPVGDGKAVAIVTAQGRVARLLVVVRNTRQPRQFSFVNDISPILSKAGCNSGGCHGKASGQNGFKLTVFAYDPKFDYEALVQEGRGRRVFRGDAKLSLILLKPTMSMPHGGGLRFAVGSPEYRTLLHWVESGAPYGPPDAPQLTRVEVLPKERELCRPGEQQIQVTALYSDGSRRDVTEAAGFSSNADTVASVDERGRVQTGGMSGQAAIMVRYMGQVAVSRVVVPRPGPAPPSRVYRWLEGGGFIDRRVAANLRRLRIAPSEPADDATFLRRVSLDLIGTLPDVAEARAFFSECAAERQSRGTRVPLVARARLVDRLLNRSEYAAYWALRWADVLRVDRDALGSKGAFVFHRWLLTQMARNIPYDRWVRELLLAQGSTAEAGPANLYRAARTPEDLANTITQVFLGVRLQCAQCHHHPFEKWSQEDFWGIAAYFARLQRKPLTPDSELLYPGGTDEVRHPRTGITIAARVLESPPSPPAAGGSEAGSDRRQVLAAWLASRENRFFARILANRLWAHLMGRGLVEPVDDLRDTNPAVNAPLLEALAAVVVRSGFDQKALIRRIVTSRVYQLSPVPNATNSRDDQNFSRALVKYLPAEVLLDAICSTTGVPEKFEGVPEGARALELWDNRLPSYFLDAFGRPLRVSPCECERSQEPSMAQALHLLNSPDIHAKIADRRGRAALLACSRAQPSAIIEELYLAALCRPPGPSERRAAMAVLRKSASRRAAAEDLLWALMNSFAFVFNR